MGCCGQSRKKFKNIITKEKGNVKSARQKRIEARNQRIGLRNKRIEARKRRIEARNRQILKKQ